MNAKTLRATLIVLAVLALATLACGQSGEAKPAEKAAPTATQAAQTEDKPTNTPRPEPTATPAPEMPGLGGTLEQSGVTLTAVQYADPATPGLLYKPTEGKKLVAVEIIVGNVGDKPISVNPLNATLIDAEGFTYNPELASAEGQIDTLQVNPGERITGWIGFEIPDAATGASIKYQTGTFSGPELKVGLAATGGQPQPAPEYTRPIHPPLGETVEAGGYSLTALQVEDPATPGMLYKPTEGTKLIAVEIIVGNVSGEQLSVNPLYAVLVDTEGYLYSAELGGRDGQIDTGDLNKGEKTKGWVAFQVPTTATAESIRYAPSMFEDTALYAGLQ